MLGKTHLIYGLSVGAAAINILQISNPFLASGVLISSGLGSIAPDIDFPPGYRNDKWQNGSLMCHIPGVSLISMALSKVSSHRRFWHTILGGAILSFINFITWHILFSFFLLLENDFKTPLLPRFEMNMDILQLSLFLSFMFFMGITSHLILDSFNPQGVPWKFPFDNNLSHKQRINASIINCTTGSTKERIFTALGCFLFLFLIIKYFLGFVV